MKVGDFAWALLITAVIAAPIGAGLYIADLLAENARLNSELQQVRTSTQDLLTAKSHFAIKSDWTLDTHPQRVKETGAEACFSCHVETFCSYCHIRLAQSLITSAAK